MHAEVQGLSVLMNTIYIDMRKKLKLVDDGRETDRHVTNRRWQKC